MASGGRKGEEAGLRREELLGVSFLGKVGSEKRSLVSPCYLSS